MGDAPYIIVKKNRPGGGQVRRDITIARYWIHKETRAVVQVINVQNVKPEDYLRIIFIDPAVPGMEMSMPLKTRENPFQPPGRSTPLMEPGFEDKYEVYENQRTTRA
jgi:hypothetical protein